MATETFLVPNLSTPQKLRAQDTQQNTVTVDRSIFPDGIKTSGQHPPIDDQVKAFEDFPVSITGHTVWKPEEYAANRDAWVHRFTSDELSELDAAATAFVASGDRLVAITKNSFKLPQLSGYLRAARVDILNGKGFVLLQGIPVESWGRYKAGVVFMGLSVYLGNLISQCAEGLILGHVTDQGQDPTRLDTVKISRTNAAQPFHTDECDIVGLLCLAPANEGGQSAVCSAHTVWNEISKTRPDVLKLLTSQSWYVDRKGEVTEGQEGWIKTAIFLLEPWDNGRVYVKWDPSFVKSLSRFSDKDLVPPLSPAQQEAMHVLEKTCLANSLNMQLELGDVQFISCNHLLHARTAFVDHEPPMPQRHLFRTWMATPDHDGGWVLPFHDSGYDKRGGVQVGDQAPIAEPLITA